MAGHSRSRASSAIRKAEPFAYLTYGATVREVMEIHGWRKLETAQRYLHTGEPLAAAAERLSAVWEDVVRE